MGCRKAGVTLVFFFCNQGEVLYPDVLSNETQINLTLPYLQPKTYHLKPTACNLTSLWLQKSVMPALLLLIHV